MKTKKKDKKTKQTDSDTLLEGSGIEPDVCEELLESFKAFVNLVPARRLSRDIRTLFLVYLKYELPVGAENFVDNHIRDLLALFDFLQDIEALYDQAEIEDE